MLDTHTIERLQRLREIGMKTTEIKYLISKTLPFIQESNRGNGVAVRLKKTHYKYKTSDGSNGNEIWAIARWGKLRTIMLRNEWQSKTPESFGVDRVVFS